MAEFASSKKKPSGRHLLRRAGLLLLLIYQIKPKMSMIWPFFVIISIFLICLVFRICDTRKLRILSSRIFVLEVSMIRFGHCFSPFFNKCSSVFADTVFGDFISNSIPSSKISGLFCPFSNKNSTLCPAIARILTTLSSCGQTFLPGGIKTPLL